MRPSQKDLFEECSRTQLRVKDDEMILPRGVTGFWSVNAAPLPLLDEKAFCQMCYSIALENGGTVTEVDTDTAIRNFYSAKLGRYDQSVFLLQNIHYPYQPLLSGTPPVVLFGPASRSGSSCRKDR